MPNLTWFGRQVGLPPFQPLARARQTDGLGWRRAARHMQIHFAPRHAAARRASAEPERRRWERRRGRHALDVDALAAASSPECCCAWRARCRSPRNRPAPPAAGALRIVWIFFRSSWLLTAPSTSVTSTSSGNSWASTSGPKTKSILPRQRQQCASSISSSDMWQPEQPSSHTVASFGSSSSLCASRAARQPADVSSRLVISSTAQPFSASAPVGQTCTHLPQLVHSSPRPTAGSARTPACELMPRASTSHTCAPSTSAHTRTQRVHRMQRLWSSTKRRATYPPGAG